MIRTLHTDSRPEDRVRPPKPIHPDACRIGHTPPEFVPAITKYGANNTATISHPSGDLNHENARLARERAAARGYHVVTPNTPTIYRRSST